MNSFLSKKIATCPFLGIWILFLHAPNTSCCYILYIRITVKKLQYQCLVLYISPRTKKQIGSLMETLMVVQIAIPIKVNQSLVNGLVENHKRKINVSSFQFTLSFSHFPFSTRITCLYWLKFLFLVISLRIL